MSVVITILAAFGTGLFASAIGALPAVILTGFGVCIGMIGVVSGTDFNWISSMVFSMFLGPQVAFGPACVAACYASKKGYLKSSMDIVTPLITLERYDPLIVGGLCGVAGWYMNVFLAKNFGGKIDTVAFTIVIMGLACRMILGGDGIHGIIGKVPAGKSRFGINSCSCWLPHMTEATGVKMVLIGGSVGAMSGYLTILIMQKFVETGNQGLESVAALPMWGIAIVACLLLVAGFRIPVFHHISYISALAAKMVFSAGGSPEKCILWAVSFGIFAAFAADFLSRMFCVNGEGYVDPPTMAVAAASVLLLWIFPALGVYNTGTAISWVLPAALTAAFTALGFALQNTAEHCVDKMAAA
jgi:hypothetical protein